MSSRHLVETGLTLLHDAHLDFSYLPYSFQTASYLINRQPTPLLQGKSLFEVLFGQPPNYLKFLKKIGCICYPLTRPYNSNKMQPKSKACLFLDYSKTQNAYQCFDPQTKNYFSPATCYLMNITSTTAPFTLYPQCHHSQIRKLTIFFPFLMPS